jgi:hypothetical protein
MHAVNSGRVILQGCLIQEALVTNATNLENHRPLHTSSLPLGGNQFDVEVGR